MLIIALKRCGKILFRIDAWDRDCEKKAREFIRGKKLKVLEDKITMMGDRVVWVEF